MATASEQNKAVLSVLDYAKDVHKAQSENGLSSPSPKETLLTVIQGHEYEALDARLKEVELPYKEKALFETYNALITMPHDKALKTSEMEALKQIAASENNNLAHDAYILLSIFHLKRNMVAQGLHYAAEAVNTLEISQDSQKLIREQYFAYQLLFSAMVLDQNYGGAIEVAERFVAIAEETNLDVSYITLATNFAYLYSSKNQDEAAFQITSTIVKDAVNLPEAQANHIYFTHGKSALKVNKLTEASQYLERSIALGAKNPTYSTALAYQASALARLGQTEKAQRNIDIIKVLLDEDYKKNSLKLLVERAQIDIAFARGDYQQAYNRLEDWAANKISIAQGAITKNRKNMSNEVIVAQRVNETKIAALETEAKLQDALYERERKNRQRLSIAAIILLVISLALFVQQRRVKKLNADIAIARDEALESERVKTDFLAMVSHEVRTPLNAIIPLVEIMLSDKRSEKEANFLHIIQENAQSLLSMFDNILTIASDQSQLEYVDTVDLRKELAQIAKSHLETARKRGNKVSLKIAQNVIQHASLDKRVLRRSMDNVIDNATKFTQNGEIDITVRQSVDSKAIHIQITDTGIGCDNMSDADLFDAFIQNNMSKKRSFEGLGIGLATSKTLLDCVGGSISREKREIGSCFTISLPMEQVVKPSPIITYQDAA